MSTSSVFISMNVMDRVVVVAMVRCGVQIMYFTILQWILSDFALPGTAPIVIAQRL